MRLLDLEPKWLMKNGHRVGIVFRNPVRPKWWTSCFFVAMPDVEQEAIIEQVIGDVDYQGCNPASAWQVNGGAETASFETLTITPSLDGGPGWWHGYITDGAIT